MAPSELEGLPDAFIKERTGDDGKVTLTLKYPDIVPVFGQCAVEATRKALMQVRAWGSGDGPTSVNSPMSTQGAESPQPQCWMSSCTRVPSDLGDRLPAHQQSRY